MFFLGVAGYFALQIGVRLFLGGSVELDEAEQLVMTQEWHLGYEVQPPLYTWMQAGVFAVFGINLFAFALLKNLLLAGVCGFVFAGVREMTGAGRAAIAAAAGMFLLPQFVWEAQRDQTHSVLATFCAAATLWRFIRLGKDPAPINYVWFGGCAALGCLSKYNYAIFLVTLLLAALSLADFRKLLLRGRALIGLFVFAAVLAPHLVWMATHRATVLARAGEVQVAGGNIFSALGASLGSLGSAVVAFSGLAVAAFAILFWRAPAVTAEPAELPKHRRLIGRILVVGGWLCLGMVVGVQARFKDRWMSPLLFLTPVLLTLAVYQRLDAVRLKRLLGLTAGIAGTVLVILLVTPFWAAATGHHRYLNPAYATLAAQIKARGFERGLVIASDRKLGGNLRLNFKDSKILGVNFPAFTAPANSPGVVVWSADRDGSIAPPEALTNLVWQLRGVNLTGAGPAVVVSIPREHTREQPVTFVFSLLKPVGKTGPVLPLKTE